MFSLCNIINKFYIQPELYIIVLSFQYFIGCLYNAVLSLNFFLIVESSNEQGNNGIFDHLNGIIEKESLNRRLTQIFNDLAICKTTSLLIHTFI